MHRGRQIWENMTLPEFFQLNDVYSAYGSSQNGSGFVPQQRRLEMEQSQGLKKKAQNDARSCSSSSEVRSVSNNGVKNDVQELQELLSKLNPLAEEFVPPSLSRSASSAGFSLLSDDFGREMFFGGAYSDNCDEMPGNLQFRKKKNAFQGRRRSNNRTTLAQQEDSIRCTVYVSDIDQQVTEEQLAALFVTCGQVVDCRICGDPNSVLRFAFVEFTDEEGAKAALSLAGTVLGYYPVRVLPSKTAIAPVNPTFLPRSENEREMCARTVYCTNIDKKVSQTDVKLFFESLCGKVSRLRLLGDYHHFTRIAFVEFVMRSGNKACTSSKAQPLNNGFWKMNYGKVTSVTALVPYILLALNRTPYVADSATAALNCSGAVLGSLPIRVSPSKTPVRPRNPRSIMHLKQLTDV